MIPWFTTRPTTTRIVNAPRLKPKSKISASFA
jgi:hypothetical protein